MAAASSVSRPPLVPPRLLLCAVTLAGLLVFALFPRLQTKLGLSAYGRWFLDTYAILASNDAISAGLDPYQANPLDDLQRAHVYSHWWFALRKLGLTRGDNFLVGGLSVLAYLGVALAALRPRTAREALVQALVVVSPPALLAILRGNNDLIVFAVLGAGALMVRTQAPWRLALAMLGVVVAAGLKFYPLVAAAGLVLVRPVRRLLWAALATGLLLVAVMANVWTDLGRSAIAIPPTVFTFGAPILFHDLGWEGRSAQVAAAFVLLALGLFFRQRGFTRGLERPDLDFPDRLRFVMAAALLLGCFLAGISFGYRCVFAIWLVPWLWNRAREGNATPLRTGARFALALLLFTVWSDGLFCLAVNLLKGPMPAQQWSHWQFYWRLGSQPLAWLLLACLTGWLLDALVAAWADWRTESGQARSR